MPFCIKHRLEPNNENTRFAADIHAAGPWLKGRRLTNIKVLKVICRAVHDAT
jgi:hypothetical protein